MNDLDEKLIKNTLALEKVSKLTSEERQRIIIRLLKTNTLRELASKLDVSHTTIYDWQTLRNNNRSMVENIGLSSIYKRLTYLKPEAIKDWGRLEMIKEVVDILMRSKPKDVKK